MSKTLNKIVWDIFIEESMGEVKSNDYSDMLKEYAEDMCYIVYSNMIYKVYRGEDVSEINFDDVLPKELKQNYINE